MAPKITLRVGRHPAPRSLEHTRGAHGHRPWADGGVVTVMRPRGRRWGVLLFFLTAYCVQSSALFAASDSSTTSPRHPNASELNNLGVTAAQKGQFDISVEYLRKALQVNPNDALVRKNLSGILTDWASALEHEGQVDRAEQLFLEALIHNSANGQALARLGNLCYFKRSDFPRAIAYWKQAYDKLPAAEGRLLADRISQAERDQTIERGFASQQTAHFDIRIQRQEEDGNVFGPLGTLLEKTYAKLAGELGGGPSSVTVIVYTQHDLHRTYNQRDWALGFYDGRLRLQREELGGELAHAFVAHELTHAFLQHVYGDRIPAWVHEGFAQWHEGSRPRAEEEQRMERAITSGTAWIPLKWLDQRFTHPVSRDDVGRTYVEARLVVAQLIKERGMAAFKTFLEQLSRGIAVEAAYDAAFAPSRWSATDRSILK